MGVPALIGIVVLVLFGAVWRQRRNVGKMIEASEDAEPLESQEFSSKMGDISVPAAGDVRTVAAIES